MFWFRPNPVLATWRPKRGIPATLVRWTITEWCNYRCPYCPQTHGRHEPKGDGQTAHAFDNFPIAEWISAFDRHFGQQRVSLVLTGGEPMVDRKNMTVFLNEILSRDWLKALRIDTNAWWKASQFQINPEKIVLMCTFHPSGTDEDNFIRRIRSYIDAGFKIGIVNYVMDDSNIERFKARSERFRKELGVYLHPNPLWGAGGKYSEEDRELLKAFLPDLDYRYRSQLESPQGKDCYFPHLGYEMDYKGRVFVGCFPQQSANFLKDELPTAPKKSVPCPHAECVCLDKYSFLKGETRNTSMSPLLDYSRQLKSFWS
jgi:organic radical activating enzyme